MIVMLVYILIIFQLSKFILIGITTKLTVKYVNNESEHYKDVIADYNASL